MHASTQPHDLLSRCKDIPTSTSGSPAFLCDDCDLQIVRELDSGGLTACVDAIAPFLRPLPPQAHGGTNHRPARNVTQPSYNAPPPPLFFWLVSACRRRVRKGDTLPENVRRSSCACNSAMWRYIDHRRAALPSCTPGMTAAIVSPRPPTQSRDVSTLEEREIGGALAQVVASNLEGTARRPVSAVIWVERRATSESCVQSRLLERHLLASKQS
ncbi:hypothetical protein SCHPADRAFT_752446 [Schizopora paradoxa]|uniref:Uncharacterized protein n=1 Tax=Schizopora paradoxa TaxID=27342 RepID=A0A0H2QYP1_9AGAM|nr:hypothetical protein SCHPADRAFT_752446 [Schizopora paradoxa]